MFVHGAPRWLPRTGARLIGDHLTANAASGWACIDGLVSTECVGQITQRRARARSLADAESDGDLSRLNVEQVDDVDAEALAMNPTPCEELIRLRAQCESQAKHAALYSRRDLNWVDWPDVQKARVAAEAKYKRMPATPPKPKAQALKEVRAAKREAALRGELSEVKGMVATLLERV